MSRGRTVVIVVVMLAVAGALALAAEPVEVKAQVRSVALFKNGFGYFTRVAELPKAPAEIEIGPLPAAVHGTFWLGWNQGVMFDNLRSREAKASEMRDALSIEEMLRANVGKRVRLYLSAEEQPITGRIISVPEAPMPPPPVPYLSIIPPPNPPRYGQLVLLDADGDTVALPWGSVSRVVVLDKARTQVPVDMKQIALTGTLTRGAARQPLSISYLAKGITWAPSYRVDISNPDQAILTAKATILNEIEDLKDTHVDLVTGYPNLEFSDIISPLAKKQDLAAFLNSLYGTGRSPRPMPAVMAQMRLGDYAEAAPPVPNYGTPAEGAVAEDLFYYPLEGVTLARGETGYYPLFSAQVPYKHIYTWDIPDYIGQSGYYRPQQQGEQKQVVWHSLRLTNSMNMPWTTAPAETVQGARILGQSTLEYTPPGAEANLKITQALGIEADQVELEINRQPGALTFRGSRYDLVTVQGTLKLHSHLDKSVNMEIAKLLTGEVKETSPQAEVVKLAAGLQGVNSQSKLTWKLELPGGAEQEITYSFTVYVQ